MHTGALSVDIDASGSFRGSLKGLAIAISLCNSETTQIKGKPSNSENMSKHVAVISTFTVRSFANKDPTGQNELKFGQWTSNPPK